MCACMVSIGLLRYLCLLTVTPSLPINAFLFGMQELKTAINTTTLSRMIHTGSALCKSVRSISLGNSSSYNPFSDNLLVTVQFLSEW
ncbi:hypothetical protein GGR57DRAFT_150900 [Xylariaceae sp. FL1272]|nr:hypothetical protein GGR57DRAFT_150900 [Xylariaceae sp. FL1272]